MLQLGLIGLGMLTAALIPYALVEKRWRWRWREVEAGRIPAFAGSSVYREASTVPTLMRPVSTLRSMISGMARTKKRASRIRPARSARVRGSEHELFRGFVGRRLFALNR